MKKKKKEAQPQEPKNFKVIGANIKSGACEYELEIISGIGKGDKMKVKGNGLVLDDMTNAFQMLAVHLAAIDDVFKHKEIEIKDINKMHNHEVTALFYVDGFKVKGEDDDESVILIGSKNLSSGGWMALESPKIPIDNMPSYEWAEQLKESIIICRNEVELYRAGKYVMPEEPADSKQITIQQVIDEETEGAF